MSICQIKWRKKKKLEENQNKSISYPPRDTNCWYLLATFLFFSLEILVFTRNDYLTI